jgi:hypothetical protein
LRASGSGSRATAFLPLWGPSASWLIAHEAYVAIRAKGRLKGGVLKAFVDFKIALNRYLIDHSH